MAPNLIPILAIAVTVLGLVCAFTCNGSRCPFCVYWGRRLFVLIFLLVSVSCLFMATTWPRGVLPCGLAMAVLFLGMLWHPTTPHEEGEIVS